MSDMTQEDSVRRLAEIRAWNEAGYGANQQQVASLLSLIDSLTTERDNARTRCYHLEMSSDAFREGWKAAEEDVAKLQAEVKRLREALEQVRDMAAARIGQVVGAYGYYAIASHARAALASTERSEATPPSEGEN